MRALAVFVGVLCLTGCVAPAPTSQAYQSKAMRTAGAALSQVQTARTAVATSRRGRLPHAYLEVLVSGAEDAYGSVQQTFDSVQPPDVAGADAVRDALDQLLGDGADALAALRIAVRRQQADAVSAADRKLGTVAAGLAGFDAAHPS